VAGLLLCVVAPVDVVAILLSDAWPQLLATAMESSPTPTPTAGASDDALDSSERTEQ
jgi:hypothetical protein